jgi:hypothetical protein
MYGDHRYPRLSIPLSAEFCHFKEFLLEHKN